MIDTKRCPYCAEEIRVEAIKCRYCGSHLALRAATGEWQRKQEGRMIAGVCAGLAEHFDVSVTVIRLAFVLAFLLGFGTALILYVVLWIVMPLEEHPHPARASQGDLPSVPGDRPPPIA